MSVPTKNLLPENRLMTYKASFKFFTFSLLCQKRSSQYRDRAAERRMLHGPFSIGPGQKNPVGVDNDTPSSPSADCPLEAAAEALEMTFGDSSYARKIMKSMGWKEVHSKF